MDILPSDAPKRLINLLSQWLDTSSKKLPARSDLDFDALKDFHQGLALIEPVPGCSEDEDLRFTRLGPAHKKWSPNLEEGHKFSEALHRHMLPTVFRSYNQTRLNGEPHYWEMTSVLHGITEVITYKRLLLPLYTKEGDFDCFLADFIWEE